MAGTFQYHIIGKDDKEKEVLDLGKLNEIIKIIKIIEIMEESYGECREFLRRNI